MWSPQLEKSADLSPLRAALTMQIAAHQLDEDNADIAQMILAIWSHDAAACSRILPRMHGPLGWNGVVYPNAWFEAMAARIRGENNEAAVKLLRSPVPKWRNASLPLP